MRSKNCNDETYNSLLLKVDYVESEEKNMSIKVIPKHNYSFLMNNYLNQEAILNNIDDDKKIYDTNEVYKRVSKEYTKQIETMNNIVTTLQRKDFTLKDKAKIDEIVKNANAGCENFVPLFTFTSKQQRMGLEKKLQHFKNMNSFQYIFPILAEYNNQLIIEDFKSYTLYDSSAFWEVNKKKQ